jgi:hypothetical protein
MPGRPASGSREENFRKKGSDWNSAGRFPRAEGRNFAAAHGRKDEKERVKWG